jgi:hypothetical protein
MTTFRIPCTGGCGRLVDPAAGKQCRKCKRKMSVEIRRRAAKTQRKAAHAPKSE